MLYVSIRDQTRSSGNLQVLPTQDLAEVRGQPRPEVRHHEAGQEIEEHIENMNHATYIQCIVYIWLLSQGRSTSHTSPYGSLGWMEEP